MSAVKNLRAMFEQKGETSPPDRGRSPGIPPIIGGESPRPLSKVRTDFIAIEKDGRIGLQRGISQDSNISTTRKLSGETDLSTPAAKPENRNIFADAMAQATPMMSLQNQPIPESPHRPNPEPKLTPSPFKNTQSLAGDASTSSPRRFRKQEPDANAEKSAAPEAGSVPKITTDPANGTGSGSGGKGKERAHSKDDTPKPSTNAAAKTTPKPLSVPSSSKATAKPAKSPTANRAPKSPAETSAPKLPAKTPERFPRQPEKVDTPKSIATASNTPHASSVKRPPPLQPSPASTGFVKPKPKSPTRPVRLPASLTTHTTASGSKVNPSRQSLSRTSGSFPTLESIGSIGRPPSGASVSTVATKTAGTKSLKRQRSTINRPRPSLGPPPKQPAKEYPPTKNEKHVDEGFLARMMRPTQASKSKITDKAITPPRKPAAAAHAKTEASKASGRTVRRLVPRAAAGSTTAGPSRPTTAEDIAPVVENIASAEEAIEVAKEIEGEVELPPPTHIEENTEEEEEEEEDAVENVDTLVERTEAWSLEDAPETKAPEVNGHHKEDEAKEESVLDDDEPVYLAPEASEK
ncbi:hypothetical protein B0T16DRAFT_318829 [Cercophora newfieldiana]|uniref:Uncharacterized protein n=1 Tax=Cercophora newfieldiana TaxID=92897 RepID=A0AA39YN69_9PEZI|nr:hypothetical protein B0T16DRAFT_318829 [Cercophora newfieldiana]